MSITGESLALTETMNAYCEGGRSVQIIMDRIKKDAGELTDIVVSLDQQA